MIAGKGAHLEAGEVLIADTAFLIFDVISGHLLLASLIRSNQSGDESGSLREIRENEH